MPEPQGATPLVNPEDVRDLTAAEYDATYADGRPHEPVQWSVEDIDPNPRLAGQ